MQGKLISMTRRRAIPILITVAVAVLVGARVLTRSKRDGNAYILDHTVDDPAIADARSVDLINAPNFRFTFGDGSGMDGFDVLKIGPDGQCEYTFINPTERTGRLQWKRTAFQVDAPTLANLRKLLVDVKFLEMKKEYHSNVEDGTQRWARVEASGKRKGVYWNNYFPADFMRIYDFVNQRIIGAHLVEVKDAKIIERDRKDIQADF